MGVTYTAEQQKVIDTHGCSLLVSAAAGSGKTAVLVERIVKMVSDGEHPVDIDRLLVVTFTNAAAAEMRERIRNAIGLRLTAEPENEHLQRQMTLLHNAQITTIDSFCLFVIRNHFHTIGLDPGFRIADEGELKLLKADVLGEVLEQQYGAGEEGFLHCMEYFSTGSRDKAVEDAVLKLYDFAMSNPFPEEWLDERKGDYVIPKNEVRSAEGDYAASEERPMTGEGDCAVSEAGLQEENGDYEYERHSEDIKRSAAIMELGWMKRMMEKTTLLLEGALGRISRCISLCEEPDGPYMYGELLEQEKEKLGKLIAAKDYEKRYSEFATLSFNRLPSKKDETVSANKKELVKNTRTDIKEQLQAIQKNYFAYSTEEILRQAAACSEAVCSLVDLTLLFKEAFDKAKRDKNILDFDDIEHFALSILLRKGEGGNILPTETALEYREHFAEIMIDEYQDSNLVQEYLLSAISGEEDGNFNRFMVGDVKQSIYKFRLARPEIFMEKYAAYGEEPDSVHIAYEEEVGNTYVEECKNACLEESENTHTEEVENIHAREGKYAHSEGKNTHAEEGNNIYVEERENAHTEEEKNTHTDVKNTMRIDLHKNFRSRSEVLTSTNAVFSQVMAKELGGIDYDEKAALYTGASYQPYGKGNENDTELLLYIPENGDEEAYGIASRIKQLVSSFQVTDKDTGLPRRASYKDIVILLRTTAGWDEEFKRILEEEGILAHVTSKTGYFASAEIQELLHFLRILDNPMQDIPLYGVMHSVFGGFSEEEIALVRASSPKKKCLYDAVKEYAEDEASRECNREEIDAEQIKQSSIETAQMKIEHTVTGIMEFEQAADNLRSKFYDDDEKDSKKNVALQERLQKLIQNIGRYRDMAVYMPVHELLQTVIRDYAYLSYVAAKPGGARRRANVEMLLVKASDYEKTSYYGLYHFLRYIEQLEKYDVDYGEANMQDENADVVRIMSIHKSKGLEFPICFVAGLSKGFNNRDANDRLVMDVDEGIGVDYINPKLRITSRNPRRNYIAAKLRQDNLAEELRILYVAMTRAKEKLILTGMVKNIEKKVASLTLLQGNKKRSLPYDTLLQMGSYMDVLLYAAARNQCFDKVWEAYDMMPDSDNPFYNEEMKLRISILQYEDIIDSSIKEAITREEDRRKLVLTGISADSGRLDMPLMAIMEDRFSYQYPYGCLKDLYTKTTVSELKKAGMKEENDFSFSLYDEETIVPYLPKFIRQDETVSGTDRGSAYHKVMELFDFKLLPGADSKEALQKLVETEMERMLADGKMSQVYHDVVSVPKILAFLESNIAKRMAAAAAAGKLYKEQPFVLGLPADRLSAAFPSEETVLIQGIIDAFFEEDGKYVVVDYKTDAVKTAEELIRRYRTQLTYYAEALEQLSGQKQSDNSCTKPDTEKIIYSFGLGEEIILK